MQTSQARSSGSHSRTTRLSDDTRPQKFALSTSARPGAFSKRPSLSAMGAEEIRDPYEVNGTAGPSRIAASTSKASLRDDRKLSSNKQQQPGGSRSKIPIVQRSTISSKPDLKGKGREIEAPRSRMSPVRSATKQNYSLHESASSDDDDEDMFIAPKATSSRTVRKASEPVQTPRNSRVTAPRRRATPLSAVHGSARARTASLGPSEGWSAVKPIPLKTVLLSSPPRPDRSSETESSSSSDDEVRLIENPATSARKRKAAAGEYTWDERSRSCVPKRERSRSRSLTASAHRSRATDDGTEDQEDSPAGDRSHLQNRIFPTSENDNMLKHLLTNRLHARARFEQSTPAKKEQEPLGTIEDPFVQQEQQIEDHVSLDNGADYDLTDAPMDLPDVQHDDIMEQQQPVFDFSYSNLPDDDSDDEAISRRTAFSSSDDGFEQSIIHLQDPTADEEQEENVAPEVSHQGSIIKDEDEEENAEMAVRSIMSDTTEMPLDEEEAEVDPMRVSEELPEPEAYRKSTKAQTETVLDSIRQYVNQAESAMIRAELQAGNQEQALDQENGIQDADADAPSTRSSSILSNLPPSSPPPLPDYHADSDLSDTNEAHNAIMSKRLESPIPRLASGPLSPKSTNRPAETHRHASPSMSSRATSPEFLLRPAKRDKTPTQNFCVLGEQQACLNMPETQDLTGTPMQNGRLASPHPAPAVQVPLRSPSPLPRTHETPAKLSELTNNQLFARSKSPHFPHMTPIRLRTISPAPVSVYSMVETAATPPHFDKTVLNNGILETEETHRQVQEPKMEAISPMQPSSSTFTSAHHSLISTTTRPPGLSTLSPSLRRLSRSPSPSRREASAEHGPPSVPVVSPDNTPARPQNGSLPERQVVTTHQSSLLAPPSPFLTSVSRNIRSPSPNVEAEKATADLLARVRALRSPSVTKQYKASSHATATYKPTLMEPFMMSDIQQVEETSVASATTIPAVLDTDDAKAACDSSMLNEDISQQAREPVLSTSAIVEGTTISAATDVHDNLPLAGSPGNDSSNDDISDTGLTETRSETDSEAKEVEVERSFSSHRTPSKSPGIKVVLLPLDDPQMSPNVTFRRERSMSRSTASTRSTRSNRVNSNTASKASRKLSFSDIGALDSSPTSVAASIGRRSFDALDSSSEDEEEDGNAVEGTGIGRPSPSKEIAARQLRYQEAAEGSSSSEDEGLDLSSSPTRGTPSSQDEGAGPSSAPIVTSTPARLMTTMALNSSEPVGHVSLPVTVSTPNPRRHVIASPRPTSSPRDDAGTEPDLQVDTPQEREMSEGLSSPEDPVVVCEGRSNACGVDMQEGSPILSPFANGDLELPDPKVESSQDSGSQEQDEISSDGSFQDDATQDTSAALDEARPRTSLVVPPLSFSARPSPARSLRSSVSKAADSEPANIAAPPPVSISTMPEPGEHPSRQVRSQSVVSHQESVTSQASTIVQVSSADPLAAARAAAILKVHHHYIQEGTWPAGVNPLSRAASGSSEEGERALDDLLKQAEREVSAALQEQSLAVQVNVESSQEESSMEVGLTTYQEEQRERSMSASRHFVDPSKLNIWTRRDWRALEQCFIDELRRKRNSRDPVDPAEVVRLYLETEQLKPEQCMSEWRPEKLEVRVQALIARKQQKTADRSRQERSHSVASTAYSRAPSDFFLEEDSHLHSYVANDSAMDTTYLDIPGALLSPARRRYARSAEPIILEDKPVSQQDYARHRGVSKYQSLQRRMPLHKPLSRETSLSSVAEAEETQSIASEPPPSSVSRNLSRLYPSLEELKSEMRPKKFLPVRGRSVAAAVNLFESIEEEQTIEAHWEQAWLKRKPSETDLRSLSESGKRVRT